MLMQLQGRRHGFEGGGGNFASEIVLGPPPFSCLGDMKFSIIPISLNLNFFPGTVECAKKLIVPHI